MFTSVLAPLRAILMVTHNDDTQLFPIYQKLAGYSRLGEC